MPSAGYGREHGVLTKRFGPRTHGLRGPNARLRKSRGSSSAQLPPAPPPPESFVHIISSLHALHVTMPWPMPSFPHVSLFVGIAGLAVESHSSPAVILPSPHGVGAALPPFGGIRGSPIGTQLHLRFHTLALGQSGPASLQHSVTAAICGNGMHIDATSF
jgi:hypothetical protein